MNITGYVKKFGEYSLHEKPFNHVDALIMAQLTYLNWDMFVDKYHKQIHIKEVAGSKIKKLSAGEFDAKPSEKLFAAMQKSKRFANTRIRFVKNVLDHKTSEQFFAITITLPNGLDVIAFRGTDLSLSGWKEDAKISFMEQVPSQKTAVKYVNDVLSQIKGAFYLVGHSKGGNLAYYSAMYMKNEYRRRLVKSYSFDGPGFYNQKILETREYASAAKKFVKIVPKESFVGVFLNRKETPLIVDSTYINVFQHDPFSWKITNEGDFKYMKKRTYVSRVAEQTLENFLAKVNEEERRDTTDALFMLLGKPEGYLTDIPKNIPGTIKNFVTTYFHFDKERQKTLIKRLIQLFTAILKAVIKPRKNSDV